MLPLVKKGQTVEYTISGTPILGKVFQSNAKCVWIETESGKIMRLHKRKHKIKLAEEPVEEKEETSAGSKSLDELFEDLKK